MGNIFTSQNDSSLSKKQIKNYLNLYYPRIDKLPENQQLGYKHLICNKCLSSNLTIIKPEQEWKCNLCETVMDKPSIISNHSTQCIIPQNFAEFRDGDRDLYIYNNKPITDFESFRNEMISHVSYIRKSFTPFHYYLIFETIDEYSPDKYEHKGGLFYDYKSENKPKFIFEGICVGSGEKVSFTW